MEYPAEVWVKRGVRRPIWEVPAVDLEMELLRNDSESRTDWNIQVRRAILSELMRRKRIWKAYRDVHPL